MSSAAFACVYVSSNLLERLIGDGAYALRDDVRREIGWSEPTVNRWLEESSRFARCIDPATGRALEGCV